MVDRPLTEPTDTRTALVRLLAMSVAGYVVFLMIVVAYYIPSDEPSDFLTQGLWGGAFMDFGVMVPSYALARWARDRLQRRRSRPGPGHEEIPPSDEEMPPQPQPRPERYPSDETRAHQQAEHAARDRTAVADRVPFPDDRGRDQRAPHDEADLHPARLSLGAQGLLQTEDLRQHWEEIRRRYWTGAAKRFAVGWVVLIAAATVWEFYGLWFPEGYSMTFSRIIDAVQDPVIGRWGLFAAWLVGGYYALGSRL